MDSNIAKRCAHIAVAIILVGGLIVDHAWAAGPAEVAKSIVVRYSDLDLSRPKDAQTLYNRLHVAARLVCTTEGAVQDLEHLRQYKDCIDRAMANAVTDVGATTVTAIREAKTR